MLFLLFEMGLELSFDRLKARPQPRPMCLPLKLDPGLALLRPGPSMADTGWGPARARTIGSSSRDAHCSHLARACSAAWPAQQCHPQGLSHPARLAEGASARARRRWPSTRSAWALRRCWSRGSCSWAWACRPATAWARRSSCGSSTPCVPAPGPRRLPPRGRPHARARENIAWRWRRDKDACALCCIECALVLFQARGARAGSGGAAAVVALAPLPRESWRHCSYL